jgi:putative restriction endonuclease
VRLAQGLFRRAVLSAYDSACCVTGNPVPELLIAAHIIPWSESPRERLNPRNGLCLSRLHEAAFDRGLFTLDAEMRVVLSSELKDYLPNEALKAEFARYEGRQIRRPQKLAPNEAFLHAHREGVFRG